MKVSFLVNEVYYKPPRPQEDAKKISGESYHNRNVDLSSRSEYLIRGMTRACVPIWNQNYKLPNQCSILIHSHVSSTEGLIGQE